MRPAAEPHPGSQATSRVPGMAGFPCVTVRSLAAAAKHRLLHAAAPRERLGDSCATCQTKSARGPGSAKRSASAPARNLFASIAGRRELSFIGADPGPEAGHPLPIPGEARVSRIGCAIHVYVDSRDGELGV